MSDETIRAVAIYLGFLITNVLWIWYVASIEAKVDQIVQFLKKIDNDHHQGN